MRNFVQLLFKCLLAAFLVFTIRIPAAHAEDQWVQYNTPPPGAAWLDVRAITIDDSNNKWFGTWGFGVAVLQNDDTWQYYNTSNSGLANNYIHARIIIDDFGNKWFGTYGGGVSVLRQDGSWQTYNPSNSGLAHVSINDIAMDNDGSLWFALDGQGVSVLKNDGSWETYTHLNSGLATRYVNSVTIDSYGNKWFGTNNGASVLYTDNTWQTFLNEFSGGRNYLGIRWTPLSIQ